MRVITWWHLALRIGERYNEFRRNTWRLKLTVWELTNYVSIRMKYMRVHKNYVMQTAWEIMNYTIMTMEEMTPISSRQDLGCNIKSAASELSRASISSYSVVYINRIETYKNLHHTKDFLQWLQKNDKENNADNI